MHFWQPLLRRWPRWKQLVKRVWDVARRHAASSLQQRRTMLADRHEQLLLPRRLLALLQLLRGTQVGDSACVVNLTSLQRIEYSKRVHFHVTD